MSADSASLSAQVNKLGMSNESSPSNPGASELVAAVDEMLNSLTTKFSSVSGEILSKMDDMSKRLDALEASVQANKKAAKRESEQGEK